MFLAALGVFDIVLGLMLSLCELFSYSGNGLVGTLGLILFIKGGWSIITAATSGFFFDLIGFLDLLSGLFIMVAAWGFVLHFFIYFGVLLIIKGFYSLVIGLVNK